MAWQNQLTGGPEGVGHGCDDSKRGGSKGGSHGRDRPKCGALNEVSLEAGIVPFLLLEVALTFEVGGRARGVRVLNINQISLTSLAGANS